MTDTGKLALLSWMTPWMPQLPLAPVTIDQGAQQQLIWGFPDVLWTAASHVFVLDLNTRLYVYLIDFYGVVTGDLTTLVVRYLATLTGDFTNRFRQLIQDATV